MSEAEEKSDGEFKWTEEIVEGEPHCPYCGFGKLTKLVNPGLDDNDHENIYTQAQCGDCSACVDWKFWGRRAFVSDVKAALAEATNHDQLVRLIEAALVKYKLQEEQQ